jgi:hypothetical protein
MNAVAQHKTRHIVSEIDIQLWARNQRRRRFARTFGTPLRRLALGLRVMSRLVARACVRRLFQSAPSRGDSDAQFGYYERPCRRACTDGGTGPSVMLLTDLAL